ncbi:MAG: RDD family protein [Solirubrobacterales bacterium]
MSDTPQEVQTAQAQAAAIRRRARSEAPAAPAAATRQQLLAEGAYAGLVSRVIAFSLDAALVNGCALAVGVAVGLGLSILHLPSQADTAIAAVMGVLWIVWSVGYFAFFWSTTGQTPGNRVMRIQVLARGGGQLKPLRSAIRFGCVILAAIPLLAGILMMLWDDRRRCLQDRLTRTVVLYSPRG